MTPERLRDHPLRRPVASVLERPRPVLLLRSEPSVVVAVVQGRDSVLERLGAA